MAVVELDFEGSKPNQEVGGSYHAPPGKYKLKITKAEATTSKSSGKPMFALNMMIAEGAYEGVNVRDYFVIDKPGSPGFQRLYAFLLTLGANVQGKFKIDTDAFIGKMVIASLRDEQFDARDKDGVLLTDDYGNPVKRLNSKIDKYYARDGSIPGVSTSNGTSPTSAGAIAQVPPPAAVTPPPAPMPEAALVTAAPAPMPEAALVTAAPAPMVSAETLAAASKAADDLFSLD